MPLTAVDWFGTPEDQVDRQRLMRIDSKERCTIIQETRDFLYKQNAPIMGVDVERRLKSTSMVPTEVRDQNKLNNFNILLDT